MDGRPREGASGEEVAGTDDQEEHMLRNRWGVAALAAGTIAAGGLATGVGWASGGGGTSAADFAGAINERAGTSITGDQVRAAWSDLLKERLDAEVTAGRLTQAQADEMLARAKDAPIGVPFAHGRHGGMGRFVELREPVAGLLGISAEELHGRQHDGSSLTEIARAEEVSREDLVGTIERAVKAADPDLSDAQAATRAGEIADATPPERRHGARHGGGGWGPPPGP